jgi:hypothetical protein
MEGTIQLNHFRLEPTEWAKINFTYQLQKQLIRLLIGVLAIVMMLTVLIPGQTLVITGSLVTFIVLLLFIRWNTIRQTLKSPLNRAVWNNRQVEFDASEIRFASSDGTRSFVPIRNFVMCVEHRGYYFLHLTTTRMSIVDQSAFKSKSDEEIFRNILIQHNLLKVKASKA